MGFWDGSGINWTICKQPAPRSRLITTSTPRHSIFTGRMLFLTPNQQCQSTESNNDNSNNNNNYDNVYGAVIMTKVIARVHPVHLMNVD